MASADARGHSYAALYLDIASAFYRVVRELIVNLTMSDEEVVAIMKRFQLQPRDFHELRRHLQHPTVLQDLNTPLREQAYLEEMVSSTWYSVPMSDTITQSTAGTRPGDNLADLVFAFIYSKMLETFRAALESEGCTSFDQVALDMDLRSCECMPVDRTLLPTMLDVTWADDLVVLIHTESATEIDRKLALVSGTLFDMCWARGLLPNFKTGKTECMIKFRGPQSKGQKKKYHSMPAPSIDVPSTLRENVQLRIVAKYKHLGNQIHLTLHQVHEIRVRIAQAKAAYAKHRKQIYQNGMIKQSIRVRLLQSMVLSILNYNMGTWRPLTTKEWQIYEGAIMFFYRGVLRATHRHEDLQRWPHEKVLAELQVPSAWDLLAAARLRYLGSLWRTGPQSVWWLCHCEKRWFEGLQLAFDWLNTHTAGLQDKRRADLRAKGWPEMICQTQVWKYYIKKALQHAISTNKAEIYVKQWHMDFVARATSLGLDLPADGLILRGLEDDAAEEIQLHGCVPCQMTFRTRAAWSVHAYKIHHRVAPEKHLLHGTACKICSKEYHTTTRLQRHLLYSKKCAATLAAQETVGVLKPGIANRRCDQDRPLPLPVQTYENQDDQRPHLPEDGSWCYELRLDYCPTLLNDLMQIMHNHRDAQDLPVALESCLHTIRQCYEDFPTLRQTVQKAWDLCDHDENQLLHHLPGDHFGRDLFSALLEQTMMECLLPNQTVHCSARQLRGATLVGLHAARHDGFQWHPIPQIPRPCSRHMLILHLFCGHRREGDIPEYLVDLQSPPGIHITLVPVDIILDPERGDLSCKRVREKWIFYAMTGSILGMIAGPPCETFTKSRRLGGIAGIVDGDGGPRMIRSYKHPFGLPAMRADEREHVHLSNVLLLFVHEMALELLAWKKRFFLKEHPAPPDQAAAEDLPTSWDLASTYVLRAHPEVRWHTFAQGPLGAPSPKPTTFLLRGLETLEEDLAQRSIYAMPAPLQMGRNEDRTFRTAVLKAYPPQLCLAISDSIKTHVANFDDTGDHHLVFEGMEEWIGAVLQNANHAAGMGGDRAGRGT